MQYDLSKLFRMSIDVPPILEAGRADARESLLVDDQDVFLKMSHEQSLGKFDAPSQEDGFSMTYRGGPAAAVAQWFQGKHSSVMQGAPPEYSMKNQHTFIVLSDHGVSAGYRSRGWEALSMTALMVNDL